MIICVGGCHGVGKSTVVNNLCTNAPLVKFTDVDLTPHSGNGFKQQMYRITVMDYILGIIPKNMNVIIDRSPLDFYVYAPIVVKMDTPEWNVLIRAIDELVRKMERLGIVNVMIHDQYGSIIERVEKRGRTGLNEQDIKFTMEVYKAYDAINKNGHVIDKYPIIPLQFESSGEYLKELLL
jgi:thymidylate kinase